MRFIKGFLKSGNQKSYTDFSKLDDESLTKMFTRALDDYRLGIESKWILSPPDIDDAMTVAETRDNLHLITEEANARGLQLEITKLKDLDSVWQKWILDRISTDVKEPYYIRKEIPKEQWWFWIEKLNELTAQQKSCL